MLADPANADVQPHVLTLAGAYEAALDLATGGVEPTPENAPVGGEDAEKLYGAAYLAASIYLGGRETPEGEMFPDALPWPQPIPRKLIITVAQVKAVRDAAARRGWEKYARENLA